MHVQLLLFSVIIVREEAEGGGRGKEEGGGKKGRSREAEKQKRGERDGPGPGALAAGLRRSSEADTLGGPCQSPPVWPQIDSILPTFLLLGNHSGICCCPPELLCC